MHYLHYLYVWVSSKYTPIATFAGCVLNFELFLKVGMDQEYTSWVIEYRVLILSQATKQVIKSIWMHYVITFK